MATRQGGRRATDADVPERSPAAALALLLGTAVVLLAGGVVWLVTAQGCAPVAAAVKEVSRADLEVQAGDGTFSVRYRRDLPPNR